MDSWAFELGNVVEIKVSGEKGTVIGRAEFTGAERSYYIRYKSGDGRGVQSWWDETALRRDLSGCEQ